MTTSSEIRVRAEAARGSRRIADFTPTPEAERHGLHLVLRAPDAEDSPASTAPRLRVVAKGAQGAASQEAEPSPTPPRVEVPLVGDTGFEPVTSRM